MSHPAQQGLVLLTAWIDPVIRDLARGRARESGMTLSKWIERAIRIQGVDDDIKKIVEKIERG